MNEMNGDAKVRICWSCGAAVPPENNYCGKCGKGQGAHVHWYYRHIGALFLSFAAGPVALFFVWRSPVLSRTAKWLYTALAAALTWIAVSAVLELFSLMRDLTPAMIQ